MSAVAEAISRGGGVGKVAAALGVRPPSVCKWRTKGIVPARRVPALAALSNTSYHELNPAFPAELPASPAEAA